MLFSTPKCHVWDTPSKNVHVKYLCERWFCKHNSEKMLSSNKTDNSQPGNGWKQRRFASLHSFSVHYLGAISQDEQVWEQWEVSSICDPNKNCKVHSQCYVPPLEWPWPPSRQSVVLQTLAQLKTNNVILCYTIIRQNVITLHFNRLWNFIWKTLSSTKKISENV